ncbi:MAG: hypothetical protein AMXMBFR23_07700 [Chloroflexota bacterium]
MTSGTNRVPTRVTVFPRLAWAALRADEAVDFATWSFLRDCIRESDGGSGQIGRTAALDALRQWQPDLAPRSHRGRLQRFVQRGYALQTGLGRDARYWLCSVGHLVVRFDEERPGIPHQIPIAFLTTPSAMRAQLYATVHEIPNYRGEFSRAPLGRPWIERLTGISPRAQQSYDHVFGVTDLVQERHALVVDHEGPVRVGEGYYADREGRQWRRLPDLRAPRGHERGSKSAARNATAAARRITRRSHESRLPEGQAYGSGPVGNEPSGRPVSFERTHYYGATEEEATQKLLRTCKYCRTRDRRDCDHVSGVIAFGRPGQQTFILREGRR